MTKKSYLPLIVAGLASANGFAAFQISNVDTANMITFEECIGYDGFTDANSANDVIKIGTGTNGGQRFMEHDTLNWKGSDTTISGNVGFSTEAWAFRHPTQNYSGAGTGVRTFWSDYNNNASLGDQTGTIGIFNIGAYFGAAGNKGFVLGQTAGSANFQNCDLTLRIQNVTGTTISNWNFGLDIWLKEADAAGGLSDFGLLYSTNDVDYTSLDSIAGADTAGAWTFSKSGDYSVSATVADGDYIYLRFLNDTQVGSNGTAWGLDNISVTASTVPEPSTYAMISGLLILAFTALRRRKVS